MTKQILPINIEVINNEENNDSFNADSFVNVTRYWMWKKQ